MNVCFIVKSVRLCVYRDIVVFFLWVSILNIWEWKKEKKISVRLFLYLRNDYLCEIVFCPNGGIGRRATFRV